MDRAQTLLFPEWLEDYIAPENPVRFLDVFVASLDLVALGFAGAQCAATGWPPYDPAALRKLYLAGYLHRVRSSRLLEVECQRNVEVLWLPGKLSALLAVGPFSVAAVCLSGFAVMTVAIFRRS